MNATQALAPTASTTPALGAVAAAERMAQLQAMIARVEAGPGGFAAALQAAQAGASATTSSSPSPSTLATSYQGTPTTGMPTGAAALTTSAGAGASAPDAAATPYLPLIEQAAARNGIDPALLYGLIKQESGFDPNSTSSAGALGLTQLMPGTAASLGVSEPLNPAQSVEGGARYLAEMLRRFGSDPEKALAAYNAGPGAVQSYGGVPPYAETQQYVEKVLGYAAAYRQSAPASQSSAVAVPTGATATAVDASLPTGDAATSTGGTTVPTAGTTASGGTLPTSPTTSAAAIA